MSPDARLARTLRQAVAEGLLPATAAAADAPGRPWPVVLLTALGAWLAALPLVAAVLMLLGPGLERSAGSYVIGAGLATLAVVLLRKSTLPLFVEQLAVPLLLTGVNLVGIGLTNDLPERAAFGILALLALMLAWLLDRRWLRVLLGAAAAGCLTFALAWGGGERAGPTSARAWWALHAVLGLGCVALWVQRLSLEHGARAALAAWVESTATGGLLCALGGLAVLAGMSFMVGGVLEQGAAGAGRGAPWVPGFMQSGSVLLATVAAVGVARAWPGLRRPAVAGVALVIVALAGFMPTLGAALLVLALASVTHRLALAGAAALAAVWIVGAFYYPLQWTLAHKALLLVAAGVALAGAAAWLHRAAPRPAVAGSSPAAGATLEPRRPDFARGGIAVAAVATLLVVNLGIWQKEDLIARGQPMFVELVPVDPRSLVQGDFMQLGFRLPEEMAQGQFASLRAERPQVVARRDARGVATLDRLHVRGKPLAEGELPVELTPKGGGWILVTDAWFFREGEGARWEKARYGEFRVAPGGQALLVGLADENLQPIRP